MSGLFANAVERAERVHAADAARVESIEAELARRSIPADADFDAIVAAETSAEALRSRLAIAKGVAARSAAALAETRAAEAEKTLDAEHAAENKRVAADAKLVRDLDAAIRRTAELRDALAASVARTAAANERRGARPAIVDAETRARMQPAVEAITRPRIEKVWTDANGALCGEHAAGARLVERRTGVISVQTGRDAFMPERYSDALRLVDLQGRRL